MTKEEAILMAKRVGPLAQGHRPCNLFLIHEDGKIQHIVVDSTWHGKSELYNSEEEIFEEFGTFLKDKRLIKYNTHQETITVIEGDTVIYFEDYGKKNLA